MRSLLASSGSLTASEAEQLIDPRRLVAGQRDLAAMPLDRLQPLVRTVYTSHATWALFTVEWMSSMKRLLDQLAEHSRQESSTSSRRRVLEVCAGRGALTRPMRARGIDWQSTDVNPPSASDAEAVTRCGALQAVQERLLAQRGAESGDGARCDQGDLTAVVWAWWSKPKVSSKKKRKAAGTSSDEDEPPSPQPAALDEDRKVAECCMEAGVPVVFVSEPRGGITGSLSLWDGSYTIVPAVDLVEDFVDVPNWPGFSDRTWVILPDRRR